jgi:hypothetical protein
MGDSENSRTLPLSAPEKEWLDDDPARESVSPLVAPQNILSLAADYLLARTTEWNRLEVRKDGGTPTPVRTLWKRWSSVRDQRLQASRLRSALQTRILREAGHLPAVEIIVHGERESTVVTSFKGIRRLGDRLSKTKLAEARVCLRHRKNVWDEVAARVGYRETEAEECDLADDEERLFRVLWIRRPVSLMEIAAKLHCLLTKEDPDSQNGEKPWPALRIILDDLVHLGYLMEARKEQREKPR